MIGFIYLVHQEIKDSNKENKRLLFKFTNKQLYYIGFHGNTKHIRDRTVCCFMKAEEREGLKAAGYQYNCCWSMMINEDYLHYTD